MKDLTLTYLVNNLLGKNQPFAMYFLPGQTEVSFVAGKVKTYATFKSIENIKQGFVFAPYKPSSETPIYLIDADKQAQGEATITVLLKSLDEELVDLTLDAKKPLEMSQSSFLSLVDKAVDVIDNGGAFQKVVISRSENIALSEDFNPTKTLFRMQLAMPKAFCYMTYVPEQGLWMGATPERLLEIEGGKAQTNALAGTLPNGNGDLWSHKEIDEQQIVTDYIEDRLKDVGIEKYTIEGPEEVASGSVRHLRSVFSFDLDSVRQLFPILNALHPTPAICGMPKEEAEEFILSNENYPREYYTGYLGPLDLKGSSHIFVNLRCMKIVEDSATLFVGAGITAGSVALKEWEETKVKALTLLNVIKK